MRRFFLFTFCLIAYSSLAQSVSSYDQSMGVIYGVKKSSFAGLHDGPLRGQSLGLNYLSRYNHRLNFGIVINYANVEGDEMLNENLMSFIDSVEEYKLNPFVQWVSNQDTRLSVNLHAGPTLSMIHYEDIDRSENSSEIFINENEGLRLGVDFGAGLRYVFTPDSKFYIEPNYSFSSNTENISSSQLSLSLGYLF